MAKEIVTLYIDDTSLRQVVISGGQIKAWAVLPLEPGLVEKGVVIKGAEVADKIRQLMHTSKAKEVVVGVSGLHCFTRPIVLPQLPKAMLEEAVQREASRALPVPLAELYLSWQTIPSAGDKMRVFLAAVSRKTADALFKTLFQAGVKPSFLGIKPLLLAGVVREAIAVLLDVQATEFDIVVIAEGIPQPVRTVPFAQEALSWQEKLTVIKNDLNRTITFYDSTNPEKPLAASVPILVAGDLAGENEVCQTLSNEIGHPVLPLPSPLTSLEGFTPGGYMANVGLALQKLSSGKNAGPLVVRLNLLPVAYQPKPISLTNVLALAGAVIASVLLVALVLLSRNVSADIASVRAQLSTTEKLSKERIAQRNKLTAEISALETGVAQVEGSRDQFAAALGSFEEQSTVMNRALAETQRVLPPGMGLSSISHAEGVLTVHGWAPDEKDVLFYLRQLERGGRFGQIMLSNMSRAEEGVVFTLVGSMRASGGEVGAITVVIKELPPTVSLTNISASGDVLTINIRAPDESVVLSYAQRLKASGAFGDINIASASRNEKGEMDFSLTLKIGE